MQINTTQISYQITNSPCNEVISYYQIC